VQDRLDELGEGVPLDTAERVQVMWTLVTDYCEMFKNTIRTWVILLVRGGGGTLFFYFFSYSSQMGWVIVKTNGHLDMLSKGLDCSH